MSDLRVELARYFEAFDELRGELIQTLEGWDTPVIVVFGPHDAGKSTLLERLALLPLFPKGPGLCTRVPIRIRMRTGEETEPKLSIVSLSEGRETVLDQAHINGDISQRVHETMDELIQQLDHKERGVRADRLIQVELWGERYPNIDLLDLPGIMVAPGATDSADLPEQTYQLVLDTIDRVADRAIFLAVREAGDKIQMSPTTNVLLDRPLIKPHCMGVLTKCDLHLKLIADQLEASAEWGLGYGYVATMNKPLKRGARGLNELAAAERAWFQKSKKRRAMVSEKRAGCDELVEKLSEAYHLYLKEGWAPNTMTRLAARARERLREIKELGLPDVAGTDTETIGTETLIEAIQPALTAVLRQVRVEALTRAAELMRAIPIWGEEKSRFGADLSGRYDEESGEASFAREDILPRLFDGRGGLTAELVSALAPELEGLSALIRETLSDQFSADSSSVRLGRFPVLLDTLCAEVDEPQLAHELSEAIRDRCERFLLDRLRYRDSVVITGYADLRDHLITASLGALSEAIPAVDLSALSARDPSLFEDSSTPERARLTRELEKVKDAQRSLSELFGQEIPSEDELEIKVRFVAQDRESGLTWALKALTQGDKTVRSSLHPQSPSKQLVNDASVFCLELEEAVSILGYSLEFSSAVEQSERRTWTVTVQESSQSSLLKGTSADHRQKIQRGFKSPPQARMFMIKASDAPLVIELHCLCPVHLAAQLKNAIEAHRDQIPEMQVNGAAYREEVKRLFDAERWQTCGIFGYLSNTSNNKLDEKRLEEHLDVSSTPLLQGERNTVVYARRISEWHTVGDQAPWVKCMLKRGVMQIDRYTLWRSRSTAWLLQSWSLYGILPDESEVLLSSFHETRLVRKARHINLDELSAPIIGVKLIRTGPNYSNTPYYDIGQSESLSLSRLEVYGVYYPDDQSS